MTERKTIKNKDLVTGFEGIVVSKNKTIKKKEFSILDLKKKVETVTAYKEDSYIPFSFALKSALRMEGIPQGYLHQIIGHSNTGKSTMLAELAIAAQKKKILPCFFITEYKFSWSHLELMSFDRGKIVDQDVNGNPIYDGFFIYKDGFESLESLFLEINKILDLQDKGEIPFDLLLVIDSFGSITSKMGNEVNEDGGLRGGGMRDALTYSSHLKGLKGRIGMSRKIDKPFTNTLLAINQSYLAMPTSPMAKPKLVPRGGESLTYSCAYIFRCGGILDAGINKETCIVSGKKIVIGYITKIAIEKNHETIINVESEKVFLCPHGFMVNDKSEIDRYKSKMRPVWEKRLKEMENNEEELEVDKETGEILNINQPIKAEL